MQSIQIFKGGPVTFVVTCFYLSFIMPQLLLSRTELTKHVSSILQLWPYHLSWFINSIFIHPSSLGENIKIGARLLYIIAIIIIINSVYYYYYYYYYFYHKCYLEEKEKATECESGGFWGVFFVLFTNKAVCTCLYACYFCTNFVCCKKFLCFRI